ncbi:uncharacterized protein LOC143450254 [Clavelina lepadiformis]|uniref:uncharacterized protein LOC143450254 n=1 Tax=Clavelina lepadiformis TaxID=159417 RepID=UPI00404336BC
MDISSGNVTKKQNHKIMQNMLDALIKFEVIEEDEITGSADSIVTTEMLWKLFQKAESDFVKQTASQNKELIEVQKYVDHVRTLSEERDHLTAEFERENERLKLDLQKMKEKTDNEREEIVDMCQQENLEELIGSSYTEQMAYLLVVRATLLDKLDAMQEQLGESTSQHEELKSKVKVLTSEDNELQKRMNNAMCEMGGMASKLTDAMRERDSLKTEIEELKRALHGINTLPSLTTAKAQANAHLDELEKQKVVYQNCIENLQQELLVFQGQQKKNEEMEAQIEELQEANVKLQDMTKTLKRQINENENLHEENVRSKMYADSQKIIEEMQVALEEDEAKSQMQQATYKKEIKELKDKITDLEAQIVLLKKQQQSASQLKAQLKEAQFCNESQQHDLENLRGKLKASHNELSMQDATSQSRKEQLNVQFRISSELQERNITLEAELRKVMEQLKESHEKLNKSQSEKVELRVKDDTTHAETHTLTKGEHEDVLQLMHKISELENLLFTERTNLSSKSDKNVELQREILKYEEQLLKEKKLSGMVAKNLEEKLSASQSKIDGISEVEQELRNTISNLQQRALNAEAQVLLISGQKDQQETQKLVADLNRTQLEDAVELLRKKLEACASQVKTNTDKYKNLKQKHKTKIRRIRELFLLERKATSDEIEKLEHQAASAEDALKKELAWKDEAACDIRNSEHDRRNAINQADIAIKKAEASSEKINQLAIAKEGLESENGMLQKQLLLLEKQKSELEKMIESTKLTKQKEELNTLLSSLSLSGSLPYLGSSTGNPQNHSSDTLRSGSNRNINDGLTGNKNFAVASGGDNETWNRVVNFYSHDPGKDGLNSSYLNLSQGDAGPSLSNNGLKKKSQI